MRLAITVPYLKDRDIESAVTELLRKYADATGRPPRPPINVDLIVDAVLGLQLEVDDLKSLLKIDDVLGATWFEEKRICVDQSLEGKEGRFSFTVAHEIGHWQLHRPLVEMDKVTLPLFPARRGEEPRPAIVCRTRAKKERAEWQADQFAARLLMPASDVQAALRAVHEDGVPALRGLDASREAGELLPELRDLADRVREAGRFENVSNQAMCYRLLDLRLVEDASRTQGRLL